MKEASSAVEILFAPGLTQRAILALSQCWKSGDFWGFKVVILGTFDGYPEGLICIANAFSELSGMLRCTLSSGSVTVSTAMGMRDKIRVGKRRCI